MTVNLCMDSNWRGRQPALVPRVYDIQIHLLYHCTSQTSSALIQSLECNSYRNESENRSSKKTNACYRDKVGTLRTGNTIALPRFVLLNLVRPFGLRDLIDSGYQKTTWSSQTHEDPRSEMLRLPRAPNPSNVQLCECDALPIRHRQQSA